jgi:hypothetical protein
MSNDKVEAIGPIYPTSIVINGYNYLPFFNPIRMEKTIIKACASLLVDMAIIIDDLPHLRSASPTPGNKRQ